MQISIYFRFVIYFHVYVSDLLSCKIHVTSLYPLAELGMGNSIGHNRLQAVVCIL